MHVSTDDRIDRLVSGLTLVRLAEFIASIAARPAIRRNSSRCPGVTAVTVQIIRLIIAGRLHASDGNVDPG